MKHYYFFLFLLIIGVASDSYGQQKVWADRVLDVTRATYPYPKEQCAAHALGKPNVYPNYGDLYEAWSPDDYADKRDTITFSFSHGAPVDSIFIYQTYEPGLIDSVWIKNDGTGVWNLVYSVAAPSPTNSNMAEILKIGFTMTTYNVSEVRLGIASDLAGNPVQIDAIAIAPAIATPWSVPAGNSITFDGVDDGYYSMIPSKNTVTDSSMTIAGWVKVDGSNTTVANVYDGDCIICDADYVYFGILQTNMGNGDSLYVYNYPTSGAVSIGFDYPPGEWFHIAMVLDNDSLYAFKNGILVGQIQCDKTDYIGRFLVLGHNLYNPTEYFQGEIESFSIYNIGLSAEGIREIMHVTPDGSETGLTAHISFNESTSYYTSGYDTIMKGGALPVSVLPVGPGMSDSQLEANGIVNYTGTDFEADYSVQNAGEVTTSKINNLPYMQQTGNVVDSTYWVVNQFNGTSFTADYSFTTNTTIDTNLVDCYYVVYGRAFNSFGTWTVIDTADVVNVNTLTFNGISDSIGQFYFVQEGACTGPLGIEPALSNSYVKVYPNPGKGIVYIDISESLIDFDNLTVSNNLGQIVHNQSVNDKSIIELNLPDGIYFAILDGQNTRFVHKLIVNK
jgi:hypothetical protein